MRFSFVIVFYIIVTRWLRLLIRLIPQTGDGNCPGGAGGACAIIRRNPSVFQLGEFSDEGRADAKTVIRLIRPA